MNEFLELKEMVEDKTEARRRALGACFQRCWAKMGDVTVGIFRKVMEFLVESSVMYGAEMWGCSRHLESIEYASPVACSQNVIWSGHTSPQGILVARNQVTTCCVGGTDALCEILVEGVD